MFTKDMEVIVQHHNYRVQAETRIKQLEETVKLRDEQILKLTLRNEELDFQLKKLLKEKYGSKKDKVKKNDEDELPDQEGSVIEGEVVNPDEDKAPIGNAKSSDYGSKKKKKGTPGSIRKPIPMHLERRIIEIDLDECDKACGCGGRMHRMGIIEHEKLEYIPDRVVVLRFKRHRYGCNTCYKKPVSKPMIQLPIQQSAPMPSLLAHTIVSKYADSLPFHRQADMWKRQNIGIMDQVTLRQWSLKCADLLEPVVDCMRDIIVKSGHACADETTSKVIFEEGVVTNSKSFMWIFATGDINNPMVVFKYNKSRAGKVANDFFEGFQGYLQSDGFSGYNELRFTEGITSLGCWDHVRRKFVDVVNSAAKKYGCKAQEALKLIKLLYVVERVAKPMGDVERKYYRNLRSKPVLNALKKWLDSHVNNVAPKSPLGIAVNYALNHWQFLNNYLKDGRTHISNCRVEQLIKRFALGRKNWVSSQNERGARANAIFYSLILTCRARGINPYDYMKKLLEMAPYCKSKDDWSKLVPGALDPYSV